MTPPIGKSSTLPPDESIGFNQLKRYSLKLEAGLGRRDFGNNEGMDHSGPYFRLGAGVRFQPDRRHSLTPRIFFEYQGLNKDLGEGVRSQATAYGVGAELDYGFAIHPKWFSVHAIFGMGAGIYRSPQASDGSRGAEFTRNPQLAPLRSTGTRLDLGLQACTWRDALCLGLGFAFDIGVNPKIDVIDGNFPALGLNPQGLKVGFSLDVFRLVGNVRRKENVSAAAAESSTPTLPTPIATPGASTPVKAIPNKTPTAPIPVSQPASAPKEAPAALTLLLDGKPGLPRFRSALHLLKTLEAQSKELARITKPFPKLIVKQLKTKVANAQTRAFLEQGFTVYHKALKLHEQAEAVFMQLQKESRKLSPREYPQGSKLLRQIKLTLDGIYLNTLLTHGHVAEGVREFNAASTDRVKFPKTLPVEKPVWKQRGGNKQARILHDSNY